MKVLQFQFIAYLYCTNNNNMKKFQKPSTGEIITTRDKAEIKMMKACGWKEIKPVKQYFAKGLSDGKTFLN